MNPFQLYCIILTLEGCSPSALSLRPEQAVREEQNRWMLSAVRSLGQDGDWLATRGYKSTDELVATVTNAQLSHVAVLDLENNQVIEADSSGVHRTPLSDFIDHSHRVILIRPVWAEQGAKQAVQKARSLIGKRYDFTGTVGLNDPESYYCSELALSVYKDFQEQSYEIPAVIEPAHMYLWGTILFDSRPRHWK